MALEPAPVVIKLQTITRLNPTYFGSAEPFLWVAFFKIDGETTTAVTGSLVGTATVEGRAGNHGDLGTTDVDQGDVVPIPPAMGEFSTTVVPIPGPFGPIPGVVGCVAVMFEQDETPDDAIAAGHDAFNAALQQALDGVITTIDASHQSLDEDDIKALTDEVGDKVKSAISDNVSFWEWLGGFGNEDDQIGSAVFYTDQAALCGLPLGGMPLRQEWDSSGEWRLEGQMSVPVSELEVGCIHKPSGNVEAHHIEVLGGTLFGANWKISRDQAIGAIEQGFPLFVNGADGSRTRVEVGHHWTSTHNPSGKYLLTQADATKADNLLSLPDCG